MAEVVLCKICGKRKPRRYCPAVQGDICPICCGTHREVTYLCPLECEYLEEAHRREKPVPLSERELGFADVRITEEFLKQHEQVVLFCAYSLVQAALRTPGAVDTDVLEALAAVVQTHKTLESGLVYQTVPENTVAAGVQRMFSASIADFEKLRRERESLSPVRPSEWLNIFVFFYQFGQQNINGKPLGRMYIDVLRQMTPDTQVDERAPSIIL